MFDISVVLTAVVRPMHVDFLPLRRCVNAKVSEMAALEKEAKKRPRRVALMPKVFGRKNSNGGCNGNVNGRGDGGGNGSCGLLPRPTLREIAEAREELMKLVVFLHLRE